MTYNLGDETTCDTALKKFTKVPKTKCRVGALPPPSSTAGAGGRRAVRALIVIAGVLLNRMALGTLSLFSKTCTVTASIFNTEKWK